MLEKILDFFLKNIEKLPAHAMWIMFFVVGGLAAFSFAFVKFPEFRGLVVGSMKRVPKDAIDKDELMRNDLFLAKPLFERYISNILFSDKDKEWIFDTILTTKINKVLRIAEELIKQEDFEPVPTMIKYHFNENLNRMILSYEEEILAKFIAKYGYACGNELFDYVYYEGFRVYHNGNVEHIIRTIEKISYSAQPLQFKLTSYLLNLYVALDMAIFDCERVFKDFNGHITEIIRKHEKLKNTVIS